MFIEVTVTDRSQPITLNIMQIVSIEDNLVFTTDGRDHDLIPESLRKVRLAIAPKTDSIKNNQPKRELLELFERLHRLTGGKGNTVFSLQREKKLNDLLTKHRMTPELLIKAATNIGNDDFLQGENDNHKRYGDIDYLLRPDKAAKWSEDQNEKKRSLF